MNKAEREELREYISNVAIFSKYVKFRKLLDYVDMLESAWATVEQKQASLPEGDYPLDFNTIMPIMREALAKGK